MNMTKDGNYLTFLEQNIAPKSKYEYPEIPFFLIKKHFFSAWTEYNFISIVNDSLILVQKTHFLLYFSMSSWSFFTIKTQKVAHVKIFKTN